MMTTPVLPDARPAVGHADDCILVNALDEMNAWLGDQFCTFRPINPAMMLR